MGQKTNETRAAQGQTRLRVDPKLTRVAQRHACDLARRQRLSHQDQRGRKPLARVKKAGFKACFSAENIAQGTRSAGLTVGAWQKSASHARNQQDPRARAMGFGVARGVDGLLYWVGLYATLCRVQTVKSETAGVQPFRW